MRLTARILTIVGMALVMALPAQAQRQQRQGGGRGFGGRGQQNLVLNKGVQQELKLADDQVKKIEEAVKSVRDKHQGDFQGLQDLDQEARREKMTSLMRTIGEETKKALAGILKPEQEKRLKQIELQQSGARAFMDADVQKALKLSQEQQDNIKTIAEDAEKGMREAFQGGRQGGNFEEIGKKISELRKDTANRATEVLNADQKKAWKELVGEPFEVKFEIPGRRARD